MNNTQTKTKSGAEPGKPSSGGSGGGGKGTSYTLPPVKNDEIIKPGTASKTELPFKDLEGFEWAEKAIFELKERGIIDGVNNNEYRPGLNVKREEFIKMLTYGLKLTGVEAKKLTIPDVKQEDWFLYADCRRCKSRTRYRFARRQFRNRYCYNTSGRSSYTIQIC